MLDLDTLITPSNYEGFVNNLDEQQYRKVDALCSSDLKQLAREPFLYFNKIVKKKTPAMIEGTLLHLLLCEPHKLEDKFLIIPSSQRRTQEVKEEAGEREIIKMEDFQRLEECAFKTKENILKIYGIDLDSMDSEVSYFGAYEGHKAKCRADKLSKDRKFCIDIKKTQNASVKEFTRSACSLDYCIQEHFYRKVMNLEQFIWLAIETDPIQNASGERFYRFRFFETSPEFSEQGKTLVDRAMFAFENGHKFQNPVAPPEFFEDLMYEQDTGISQIKPPLWYFNK